MHIWPLTDGEREECIRRATDSNNWEVATYEGDPKWEGIYGPIVQQLRTVLPQPLNAFDQGLHGNLGYPPRKRHLHFWYDNIPNIHFEVEVPKGDRSMKLGVHLEKCHALAKRIRRYLTQQVELPHKVQHLASVEFAIDRLDEEASLIAGRQLRDLIGVWVPRIREALLYAQER